MSVQRVCATGLVWLLSACAVLSQTAVKVVPKTAVAGGSGSFSLSITSDSGSSPASLEWTLGYSSTDLSNVTITAGPASTSAGKSVSCTSGTGTARCIIWGLNTTAIVNGVIATASFAVSKSAAASSVIQLTKLSASSPAGEIIAATGTGATLTITSANQVAKLGCTPTSLLTPASATCTVTLASAATAAVSVSLGLGTNSAKVTIPASVTVPVGASSATFTLEANAVAAPSTAVLVASLNGSSATVSIPLSPAAGAPVLKALACSPSSIVTPADANCSVTLVAAAASAATVSLQLGTNSAKVTIPASVTVPAGASKVTFTLVAGAVAAPSTAVLVASLNGSSETLSIPLLPTAGAPVLKALACSPSSIVTPADANCSVTLEAAAGSAASVSLGLGTNSAKVTIPASVTVPAGATKAFFTLVPGTVTASTTAVIVAKLGSVSLTLSVPLLPPS